MNNFQQERFLLEVEKRLDELKLKDIACGKTSFSGRKLVFPAEYPLNSVLKKHGEVSSKFSNGDLTSQRSFQISFSPHHYRFCICLAVKEKVLKFTGHLTA
jgi:hypothetical protein